MSRLHNMLEEKALLYASGYHITLARKLGDGNDGCVWETDEGTAIKVLERESSYEREKSAYYRLSDLEVTEIKGFHVPELIQ